MDSLLSPKSVAIIGSFGDPIKAGHVILENLKEFGFQGRVYPVNPKAGEIYGLKIYSRVSQIPESVDLAISAVSREAVIKVVKDCAEARAKHLIIQSTGFSDVGASGRELEERIVSLAKESGMRILGPNSPGIINTANGLITSFIPIKKMKKGSIALVGQSGFIAAELPIWIASCQSIGISKAIDTANSSDINETDILEFLADDPETRVITMYLEGIKGAGRFIEVAKKVTARKPVLVLKSGRTREGAKAATSHTSALAIDDPIVEGIFRQSGIIRVRTLEEFFNIAKAFAVLPLAKGNKVGIVSHTGSGSTIMSDECVDNGLELAELSPGSIKKLTRLFPKWVGEIKNPLDVWYASPIRDMEKLYETTAEAVLGDENVDSVLFTLPSLPPYKFNVARLFSTLKRKYEDKPMVCYVRAGEKDMMEESCRSVEEVGVPAYTSPEQAVQALAALNKYRTYLQFI